MMERTSGDRAGRRRALNVARLPDYAFGHQGLIWWGSVGFIVIEGSMFVMVLIAYFFLRTRVTEWPPGLPDPVMTYGTLHLAVMLASVLPNQMTKSAAERLDLRRVRKPDAREPRSRPEHDRQQRMHLLGPEERALPARAVFEGQASHVERRDHAQHQGQWLLDALGSRRPQALLSSIPLSIM